MVSALFDGESAGMAIPPLPFPSCSPVPSHPPKRVPILYSKVFGKARQYSTEYRSSAKPGPICVADTSFRRPGGVIRGKRGMPFPSVVEPT